MTPFTSIRLHVATFSLLTFGISVVAQQPAGSPTLPVAQPPQTAPDSSTVTLKVQTRLTVEDVTVTDGKGKPVRGLTQSDFTVKEDGKPQNIQNFGEFGTAQTEPQAAPSQLPVTVYTNLQTTARTAVNILLIDDVTTGLAYHLQMAPQSQMFVRQQAIKYLNTMPPGTQVAILKMANELSVVQGFTSDRSVLLAAIDSLRPEQVAEAYALSPSGTCNAANNQSDLTTTGLAAVANFASAIKGRKNLIWFTPGIPWLTNYQRFSRATCLIDYTPELQKAYGLLTAARVAVYPVDPQGTNYCEIPLPGGPPPECDFNQLRDDHESELDIANATGGVAYYNRNDVDAAIREAIDNGAHYYSISYVPPTSKYDDKYHKIEVKVDRPGLHLQYREGYTDIDLAKPLGDKKKSVAAATPPMSEFHAAMGFGKPYVTEFQFDVSVQPSTQPSKAGGPPGVTVAGSLNPRLKGTPLVPYDVLYKLPAGCCATTEIPKVSSEKVATCSLIDVNGVIASPASYSLATVSVISNVPIFCEETSRTPT